jgi:hypothetical protein
MRHSGTAPSNDEVVWITEICTGFLHGLAVFCTIHSCRERTHRPSSRSLVPTPKGGTASTDPANSRCMFQGGGNIPLLMRVMELRQSPHKARRVYGSNGRTSLYPPTALRVLGPLAHAGCRRDSVIRAVPRPQRPPLPGPCNVSRHGRVRFFVC